MKVRETSLSGCLHLQPVVHRDRRGSFVKPFQASVFRSLGIPSSYAELFYSHSVQRVVRGLHFQRPPGAQAKVVYCLTGEVLDVVVDLRRRSSTYGRSESVRLSGDQGNILFVPAGFAHGFATLSDRAVMAYAVTTEHNPELDSGIRWDSIGFEWPWRDPILSDRDRELESLDGFDSPFLFDA